MKNIILSAMVVLGMQQVSAQLITEKETFTRRDSLHGGLRPERTDYDVQRYDLNITINPGERSITGYNDITFKLKT